MLFLLFWFDDLPNQCCKSTAYERTNDEYPELRKSLTTLEESRTDGTGWVNGCSGVVDTYEVNQDEGKTDSPGTALLCTYLHRRSRREDK